MARLFHTCEVQAAVAIFRYMVDEIDAQDLATTWFAADLGLTDDDLARGTTILDERRMFDPGKRFAAYNLQPTYFDLVEAIGRRKERIPAGRGEVVFYKRGKFSQVITDYEEIRYHSRPEEKHVSFVAFLRHQPLPNYPEGGQDTAYAVPDAVRIMSVHQAKGMEFPVVFLPCLQRNRFPGRRQHNRIWNHLPRQAIANADRHDGGPEDERRLFYVALSGAENYLWQLTPFGMGVE